MKKIFATLIVLAMLCGALNIGYSSEMNIAVSSACAGQGSSPMDDEVKNP